MSIKDLYYHSEHRRNLAHFASLATLATVDGNLSPEAKVLLDRFAHKLDITNEEYEEVMDPSNKYPIHPPTESAHRLERLYDLFRIIFVDHKIDDAEYKLIHKYALGLGYSPNRASELISRSIDIFSGKLNFEEYKGLL